MNDDMEVIEINGRNDSSDNFEEAKHAAFIQHYFCFKHLYSIEEICDILSGLYNMSSHDWFEYSKSIR